MASLAALGVARSRRVLIIDDSILIREAATLALVREGWDVITASSGEEGLERARAELPDAVLLDVVMPGIDGFEVAERLAADPVTAPIPVIMLTAADGAADRVELGRLAVAGVIPKPFALATLAARVATIGGWAT